MDWTILTIGSYGILGLLAYNGQVADRIKNKRKKLLYDALHGPIVWLGLIAIIVYDKIWVPFIGYKLNEIRNNIYRWFEKE